MDRYVHAARTKTRGLTRRNARRHVRPLIPARAPNPQEYGILPADASRWQSQSGAHLEHIASVSRRVSRCYNPSPLRGDSIVWQKLLWLAVAGVLGTLARYGLGGLVQRISGGEFPWGTVVVNLAGSFAFGVVWSLSQERMLISPEVRIIILVGFMGAFTTFSTFMFETSQLLRDGQWLLAMGNLLLQNVIGVVCLFAGLAVGRLV